jgi:hypothetical protein
MQAAANSQGAGRHRGPTTSRLVAQLSDTTVLTSAIGGSIRRVAKEGMSEPFKLEFDMPSDTKPLRAAVYARYSTDLQSAASIEDQVRTCRVAIEARGWELAEVYSDPASSGASILRPGYQNRGKRRWRRRSSSGRSLT